MPLEVGISMGAKRFGGPKQRVKRLIILEKEAHRYDASTSDISGQDISAHHGKTGGAINAVRDWLADHRGPENPVPPGGNALIADYGKVRAEIDKAILALRLNPWSTMTHRDSLSCLDDALLILADVHS